MTRDEVLQEAVTLVSQGWTLLPCDIPEQGTQGYVAFRQVAPEKEEDRLLQWHVFGQPLDPDDKVVEAQELLRFLSEGSELFPCDDPKKLLIGFVRYEPERGRATVRRTSLGRLKGLEQVDRERVMAARERLLAAQREAHEQRIKEIAAIQGAAASA